MIRRLAVSFLAVILFVPVGYASHDGGEKLELHGASRDGRYVLASWKDINDEDVKLAVHDVTTGKFVLTKRVAPEKVSREVRALRRAYRLRRLPRARHCHRRNNVCAYYYDWRLADGARFRSVAIVGPLGQRVSAPRRVRCFAEPDVCKAKPSRTSSPAEAYWLGSRTLLVATTWIVKASYGDTYVPLFVHRTLPKRPAVPAQPPRVRTK